MTTKRRSKTQGAVRMLYGQNERIFWALVTIVAVSFGAYIYFLNLSITNVVLREEMRYEIASINSHIGDLEATYITKKNTIDAHYAQSLGFEPVVKKHYAARPGSNYTFNQ